MRAVRTAILVVLVLGILIIAYCVPIPSLRSRVSDKDWSKSLTSNQLDDTFWREILRSRLLADSPFYSKDLDDSKAASLRTQYPPSKWSPPAADKQERISEWALWKKLFDDHRDDSLVSSTSVTSPSWPLQASNGGSATALELLEDKMKDINAKQTKTTLMPGFLKDDKFSNIFGERRRGERGMDFIEDLGEYLKKNGVDRESEREKLDRAEGSQRGMDGNFNMLQQQVGLAAGRRQLPPGNEGQLPRLAMLMHDLDNGEKISGIERQLPKLYTEKLPSGFENRQRSSYDTNLQGQRADTERQQQDSWPPLGSNIPKQLLDAIRQKQGFISDKQLQTPDIKRQPAGFDSRQRSGYVTDIKAHNVDIERNQDGSKRWQPFPSQIPKQLLDTVGQEQWLGSGGQEKHLYPDKDANVHVNIQQETQKQLPDRMWLQRDRQENEILASDGAPLDNRHATHAADNGLHHSDDVRKLLEALPALNSNQKEPTEDDLQGGIKLNREDTVAGSFGSALDSDLNNEIDRDIDLPDNNIRLKITNATLNLGDRKETEPKETTIQKSRTTSVSQALQKVDWANPPSGSTALLSMVKVPVASGSVLVCVNRTEDMNGIELLQSQGLYDLNYSQNLQSALSRNVSLGFIDVGAGIGVYSLIVASLQREVLSVEPNISQQSVFHASVLVNELQKYVTLISNIVGNPDLNSTSSLGNATVSGHTENQILSARTLTLDNLAPLVPFNSAVLRLNVDNPGEILQKANVLFLEIDIPFVFMTWNNELSSFNKVKTAEFFFRHNYEAKKDLSGTGLSVLQHNSLPHKYVIWVKRSN